MTYLYLLPWALIPVLIVIGCIRADLKNKEFHMNRYMKRAISIASFMVVWIAAALFADKVLHLTGVLMFMAGAIGSTLASSAEKISSVLLDMESIT